MSGRCPGAVVHALGEVGRCWPPGSCRGGHIKGRASRPHSRAGADPAPVLLPSRAVGTSADPPAFFPSTHCFNPLNYFIKSPHFTHSAVSPGDRRAKQVETLQRRHWERKGRWIIVSRIKKAASKRCVRRSARTQTTA